MTPTIFAIITLSSLIVILILIIAGKFGWQQYKKGAFFCFLPLNHAAMIDIKGKPVCILIHEADRVITESVINQMETLGVITKIEKDIMLDLMVSRKNSFWGILVSLFNLHYTNINPFTTIRPVGVIPTGLKAKKDIPSDSKLSEHMRDSEEVPEKFIRLAWPRVVYIHEIELKNLYNTNIIVGLTRLRVWNFIQIYYQFNGKISEKVDTTISAMFIQHLGTMTVEEFQKADMTANTNSGSLFSTMHMKGLEAIGMYLEGPIEVSDWEPGENQKPVRDANLERAAAEVKKETMFILADANAGKILREGQAEADVIGMKGSAEAEVITKKGTANAMASKKRVEAYNGDTKSSALVESAREIAQPGSNVRVIGGNVITNLGD
jgi:hypothetical protein